MQENNRRHEAGTPSTFYLNTLKLTSMIITFFLTNVADVLLPSKAKISSVLDLIPLGPHRDFAPSYILSLPPSFLAPSHIIISIYSNFFISPNSPSPPRHTVLTVISCPSFYISFSLFFPIHSQIPGRHVRLLSILYFPFPAEPIVKWLLLSTVY